MVILKKQGGCGDFDTVQVASTKTCLALIPLVSDPCRMDLAAPGNCYGVIHVR